jgi:hypothetical protein
MLPTVGAKRRTDVCLEVGPRRTFASALEWPGWSRSGLGEQPALDALVAYAPRYARAAARAGLKPPSVSTADLEVVEVVAGTAITDFGVPVVVTGADQRPLDAAGARRLTALLDAAWDELEAVVAGAPSALRKGPRGGGRDRDAIRAHVVEAERSYARKIGVRLTAGEWRDGSFVLMRQRIREALRDAAPSVERAWPPRYFARRTAWHALDHAWEIEDRSG